jgi:hypothetical protein
MRVSAIGVRGTVWSGFEDRSPMSRMSSNLDWGKELIAATLVEEYR